MKAKSDNYFGSDLNEFIHYEGKPNMVVNNIDLIFRYYQDNNKLRIVESKHLNESIKLGQKILLEQLSKETNIEVYVVFGNKPYDYAYIYSIANYNLYKVNKEVLRLFLNNDIEEAALKEYFIKQDKNLYRL